MKVQTHSAPCSVRPCPRPTPCLSGSEGSLPGARGWPGGAMAHLHYKYSLLSSAAEEYHKRPLPLQLDYAPLGVFAVLEVQRELQRPWTPMSCLRRPKVYSFIFGLTIIFFIMASYVLSSERKGLLLTPSPYHADSSLNLGTLPFNFSSNKDHGHITQVLHQILSKVEFSPRKLPDLRMLVHSEPHMFSVIPRHFLPDVKNPCWYEQLSGNVSADPYRRNLYSLYSRQSRATFQYLRSSFRKHLLFRDGKFFRIRCLPYFYIIGQPKCGTTDLYDRLRLHPDVRVTALKEPHWWTRKRFGIIRPSDGLHARYPVEDYLDLFDLPAHQIQDRLLANSSGSSNQANIIIGEASASTMWDNNAWAYFCDNATEGEPPFLIQDFIHALQPEARFIAILRDPVERLYSDYLYFGMANKSSEDFHEKVWESVQLFDACLQDFSMRACVYNSSLNNAMSVRLHVGLYVVYVLDWLSVFGRDQLLVLRLEDHAADRTLSMHRVFQFLSLRSLSEQKEAEITKRPASNTRRLSDKNLGPMLPLTREILSDFYGPFNRKLAAVLQDDSFLWDTHSKPASRNG
ncbi:carbohydrate sulfotransferase 15-like [Pygocentrus nattereri]|uniref:Sulfotransferase n=1 Tax=Pygocentrus nattereri TaxID=42514 RepID=A0A3B4DZJ5_PYGNA|nr:carbohydrate sulfotransferase 15-like [Pygocentrus nattereri]XP_037400351.1 carbohydrate sulfotransferase 15-like [Pygocentrus nattereri]XP_037400352.1 carbohydrate sulfotransferase 15-like [Pygocentrus nattereri]XP_037400353.1 carbohydrate sulfotransferase 15-like [Pygocentrus nattereri]